MKICTLCGNSKPEADFSRDLRTDILRPGCKTCYRQQAKAWWDKTREQRLAKQREYRATTIEKQKEYRKKHYDNNKKYYSEKAREKRLKDPGPLRRNCALWKKANKERCAITQAMRKAKSKTSTPKWSNSFFIREAYELASLRTKMFGFKWDVDHIVPLTSKIVCGLHCEFNLQVIPGSANNAKGNRHWPDMP